MNPPATELTAALDGVAPGRALDLACGAGRHSIWLRDRGWQVTAVDHIIDTIPGVTCIQADLERHEFPIEPQAWDLIVCWLHWQEDLLPAIAAGVRSGGIVALAGKITGRFATSLPNYRRAFPQWRELSSGKDMKKTFLVAVKPF
jgi:SAM-dependent methyltransferase